ncbi:hypothetical protein POTOM_017538 [Populus tomentosa]|uniref:ZF-HD dimerization-type domain-containing protein n=1 Tax=Populus tomentosa TaxID=118781 RepID=A0A8X8D6Q9_POPTO|nr:hypothetical protein POTOM_017538 [Populus tomentosa]
MDESSLQKDMPISRNGSYAGGNGHSHTVTSAAAAQVPTNGHSSPSSQQEDQRPYKKVVRYKECLKNHAAAIGGNATDGCGEFIPGGEEGSLEALKCSACNCHRNFHRKEIDGECSYDCHHHYPIMSNIGSGRLISGHHNGIIGSPPQGYPTSSFISSRAPPPHQVVVSFKNGGANAITSESDEKEEDNGDLKRHAIRCVESDASLQIVHNIKASKKVKGDALPVALTTADPALTTLPAPQEPSMQPPQEPQEPVRKPNQGSLPSSSEAQESSAATPNASSFTSDTLDSEGEFIPISRWIKKKKKVKDHD